MSHQAVTPTQDNNRTDNTRQDNTGKDREEPALLPPLDVIEDATGITLYADLPGVPKDRLNLRVEGETLLIDADLVLALPQDMQASHAELQQGVQRLRIPKAEHAQPRRIAVQVA